MESSKDIRSLATMKEVFDHIIETQPGWMINTCDDYSKDYEKLSENWIELSKLTKSKPQKIILVKHFENDDQLSFAELLYSAGFLVRTIHEFTPCPMCNLALPTQVTFEKLKSLNMRNIPEIWSDQCSNC